MNHASSSKCNQSFSVPAFILREIIIVIGATVENKFLHTPIQKNRIKSRYVEESQPNEVFQQTKGTQR